MKTTITVNGKPVEIELTAEQVAAIKKASEKITDRIKNFNDVLDYHGITNFKKQCAGLSDDEVAYKQVKLIALALNEGKELDPTNESEYKYYPYFVVDGDGFSCYYYDYWYSSTIVPSRLCFRTADLAIYAGKTFTDIYNKLLK